MRNISVIYNAEEVNSGCFYDALLAVEDMQVQIWQPPALDCASFGHALILSGQIQLYNSNYSWTLLQNLVHLLLKHILTHHQPKWHPLETEWAKRSVKGGEYLAFFI